MKKAAWLLTVLLLMGSPGILQAKVHAGRAYGANIFVGMMTGCLIGSAGGALSYSGERKNQDPQTVILGAVYGAIGGAVGLGTPISAYEVGSDKSGAGVSFLFDVFAFSMIGGVVGCAAGSVSYKDNVGVDDRSAEVYLYTAALGVLSGAGIGTAVGIFDAVFYTKEESTIAPPGKGIHARIGILGVEPLHFDGQAVTLMPQVRLAQLDF